MRQVWTWSRFTTDNLLQIITFDAYGISGHTNHQAISQAVKEEMGSMTYQLKSSHMLAKFSSIFGIPLSLIRDRKSSRTSIKILSTPSAYLKALRAFSKHSSQTRWYRGLYCLFSQYLWWNELILLNTTTEDVESRSGKSELWGVECYCKKMTCTNLIAS